VGECYWNLCNYISKFSQKTLAKASRSILFFMYKTRNCLMLKRVVRIVTTVLWRVKGLHTSGVAVMQARTCYTHLGGAGMWGQCPVLHHGSMPKVLTSWFSHIRSSLGYSPIGHTRSLSTNPTLKNFCKNWSICEESHVMSGKAVPLRRRSVVAGLSARRLWPAGQSTRSHVICAAPQTLLEWSTWGV
jgi:hypothetical protein